MTRKYDLDLLTKMDDGQQMVTYEGVPVMVRPIPEGGEDGDMDPRVYQSMKMMPLVSHLMPKHRKDVEVTELIKPIRKNSAEYKGEILVGEEVSTKYIKVYRANGCKVPVRIYKRQSCGENLPIFVYFHGGGFFSGGPDIVEQMCKVLVREIDCVALNVDYRLCPEAHYPQPFDDCWIATKWAWQHADELGADKNKLVVAGDSAGGNLASAITLRCRDENLDMVKMQVLLYPTVNLSGKHTKYYHGFDESKYHISKRHQNVFHSFLSVMGSMGNSYDLMDQIYLQGNLPAEHIYASPLLDDFHDLPATMLIFGEHDLLAFEDFAYARTAYEAGVDIKTIVYRGISHGFADQIGVTPQAEDCMIQIARVMKDVFSK